jgi:predicted Zn finger-like uncharacterized protein
MIVICTQCQAKFRVADEKIGPRGAKVRCSKCQTIFSVRREVERLATGAAGATARAAPARAAAPPQRVQAATRRAAPALDVELEHRTTPAPMPAHDPFAGAEPPNDPFARASSDPFAVAGGGAADGADDPFAPGAPSSDPFAPFAADPVEAPATTSASAFLAEAADPFAAAVSPRGRGPSLPVTDLSDLSGGGANPRRDDPPAFSGSDPGIALEERVTPPAFRAPAVALDAGFGAEPFGGEPFGAPALAEPHVFDPGGIDFSARDPGESLALATEPTPPPGGHAAAASAGPPPLPASAAFEAFSSLPETPLERADRWSAPAPVRAPRTESSPPPAAEPESTPDRIPGGRASRLRTVAVNAVALVVLLLGALAMLIAWRTGGRLEAAALRPSAVLAALRRDAPDAAPFAASELRTGLYERERSPPLLFVRGAVLSRARAPVPAVRVAVELVRGEVVVARGETLAGAVPTPEELWRAADARALDRTVAAARRRAPREIRPGDSVPFLVAIPDFPADVAGASVRVAVEAVGTP